MATACQQWIFRFLLVFILVACQSPATPPPAPPTAIPTYTPVLTPTPTAPAPASFDPLSQDRPTESENIDLYAAAAPEFPPDLEWLNIERPLSLAQLRGKVVLLDFWTYGCINCLHNFPELQRLQAAFPTELVIIGIHSAKFSHEGQTENIRQVILRYGLEHPVINDGDLRLWHAWNARAWPTLVLIDPAGNLAEMHVGEGIYGTFYPLIRQLAQSFAARGKLDRTPLQNKLEREGLPATVLSFPGKVTVDGPTNRLFIADTNHNRIVLADASSGEVQNIIGSGLRGFDDGDARTATFAQLQGMALAGNTLYVADTGNHAIRQIDLATGQVSTLAGTGEKLQDFPPRGGTLPAVALSSPWDLALDGSMLYVAMAGTHQIWRLDLANQHIDPWIGNAREGTQDGAAQSAELAQPSGLVLDPHKHLYFADTEASSIRRADLERREVHTLVGTGRTLFDFGDVDGVGPAARLQHPAGITLADGQLYVADTYNNKIKRIDPQSGESTTLLGSSAGWRDGRDPLFYEPGGIAAANSKLYIADTNNHAIRIVELATQETSTLVLKGIQQFMITPDEEFVGKQVQLAPITVVSGPGTLVVEVELPAGYKLNAQAPQSGEFRVAGGVVEPPTSGASSLDAPTFPLTFDVTFQPGEGILQADLVIIYCEAVSESLCLIDQVRLEAPITVVAQGESTARLTYRVPTPE